MKKSLLTDIFFFRFLQTSREERPSSAPTPEAAGNGSQELLEETLKGPKPYQNIVLPTGGGFWIDGQDQHEYEPATSGGPGSWNNKIETDDTAKAYRRYYMGRVSVIHIIVLVIYFIDDFINAFYLCIMVIGLSRVIGKKTNLKLLYYEMNVIINITRYM